MKNPRIGNWALLILVGPVMLWALHQQFFVPHPPLDWPTENYHLLRLENGTVALPLSPHTDDPIVTTGTTAFDLAAVYQPIPIGASTESAELRGQELSRQIELKEQRLQNLNFEIVSRDAYKKLLEDEIRSLQEETMKLTSIRNDNLLALLELTEKNTMRNLIAGALLGAFFSFILGTSHVKERLEKFLFESKPPELK